MQKMAAFNRLKEATYEVHESVKVDTQGEKISLFVLDIWLQFAYFDVRK